MIRTLYGPSNCSIVRMLVNILISINENFEISTGTYSLLVLLFVVIFSGVGVNKRMAVSPIHVSATMSQAIHANSLMLDARMFGLTFRIVARPLGSRNSYPMGISILLTALSFLSLRILNGRTVFSASLFFSLSLISLAISLNVSCVAFCSALACSIKVFFMGHRI